MLRMGIGRGGTTGGVLNGRPSWVIAADGLDPALDLDFIENLSYNREGDVIGTAVGALSLTRATTGYYVNRDGSLTSFASGALRYGDMGLLVEPARTNVVLWCRDLTNAAWTKTNVTAAKTATGWDGVANSCTRLTATSANGTVSQSITLASSARWQSAWMRRVTGTGAIDFSMDGGTTYTTVYPTTAGGRVEIPTQTLANPTVVIRIATSGDEIDVDFVQNEADPGQASSPIATTTVAVTRNADVVTVTTPPTFPATGWSVLMVVAHGVGSNATVPAYYQLDNSGNSTLVFFRRSSSNPAVFGRDAASVTQWNAAPTAAPLASSKLRKVALLSVATNDVAFSQEDGVIATDTVATVPIPNRIWIGNQNTTGYFNGYIRRFVMWATAISDTAMARVIRHSNDKVVLGEGDSFIAPTTLYPHGFFGAASLVSPQSWVFETKGASGSEFVHATAATSLSSTTRANAIDALWTTCRAQNPATTIITVINCGTNDLAANGNNAAALQVEAEAYFTARRAAGHKIMACTITPRNGNAAFNAAAATYNTWLRTQVGVTIDYICDWDNTIAGTAATFADTSYSADNLHPAPRLAAIMGDYLRTVLEAI